jgi:hypothetical protein
MGHSTSFKSCRKEAICYISGISMQLKSGPLGKLIISLEVHISDKIQCSLICYCPILEIIHPYEYRTIIIMLPQLLDNIALNERKIVNDELGEM